MAYAVASLWAWICLLWFHGEILAPRLSFPGWVAAGGVVLWSFSIVVFVVSLFSLRTRGKPKRGWEETTELSTGGLHSLVRHPIQLATVLAAVGITLMKPTLLVVILCTSSTACAVWAAYTEDEYNTSKFGKSYGEYMERVPRLNSLLGIWKRMANTDNRSRGRQ